MKKETRGGIVDPAIKSNVVNIDEKAIQQVTNILKQQLNKTQKVVIKNCLTLELKESNRKTRFDFKTREWIPCKTKQRISIKLHKKFTDNLLNNTI